MRIVIVSGLSSISQSKQTFTGQPSSRAVKTQLHKIRNLSAAHWAYAEVRGHRVDDDRLPLVLRSK